MRTYRLCMRCGTDNEVLYDYLSRLLNEDFGWRTESN